MIASATDWHADVPRSARPATLFGFSLMGAAVAGFGYWGSTALIAGAVVTSGSFVATGANKIVQHFEGGVIREILVREGDVVNQGQKLIVLDETAPRAELRRLTLREAQLVARQARLEAEVRGHESIEFPPDLLKAAIDPELASMLNVQRLTFEARQNNLASQVATLHDGIKGLEQRIEGGKTQVRFVEEQLRYFDEELKAKSALLASKLIRKSEVLALRRAHANAQGEIGRLTGEIGDARERISRIQEQIDGVRNAAVKSAVEQLHQTAMEFQDVRERKRAAEAVLNRVVIRAPVSGAVVRLGYQTPGGVIEAGKSILEIVPLQEELIIEVRIRPQDIDHVKQGQGAMIRLTALNRRITPMVRGTVRYVSADSLRDEQHNGVGAPADNYIARISLDPGDVAGLKGFNPTPGMPAEVFITTEDRTFLEYLLKPVTDSFSRAFREQ
jgi:HlyD family secretion protein